MTLSARRTEVPALALLLSVGAVVAGISGVVTIANVRTWYAALAKPPFNPPNGLFGPVWTLLYIAMAVAAWRIWRRRNQGPVGIALGFYAAQMVLNFAWSLLFFGMHNIGVALVDIVSLAALLAATTLAFWRRDTVAGILMAPYLAWVLFAALLNFSIWRLN
jgi:benzodiazapine receptor